MGSHLHTDMNSWPNGASVQGDLEKLSGVANRNLWSDSEEKDLGTTRDAIRASGLCSPGTRAVAYGAALG